MARIVIGFYYLAAKCRARENAMGCYLPKALSVAGKYCVVSKKIGVEIVWLLKDFSKTSDNQWKQKSAS